MSRLAKYPQSLLLLSCLATSLLWSEAVDASFQLRAQQETTSTPAGTIRGTSLRGHWLASPGVPLGNGWFLRPGAEGAYGRFERGSREQRFWEAGGLGQLNYPGESVGFYVQGGLSYINMANRDDTVGAIFTSNDVVSQVEVGIRVHEGMRLDLGYRYRRYHDQNLSTRGFVLGLSF
ncbi:opacity protein-like surface antigen [Natronospira proteinivora]|uniref:Opacity protein-like surface antigen n=1 Tax=Natronospira proteinivora TaxID=1807133 RepID=A0ABT1GAF3_9GAMM|nr:outer membrane beta-barrel protein [Natronospira proteinivora]MCP1728301.1 opacity protein-like surface antigen [Natronospira proteinivora]